MKPCFGFWFSLCALCALCGESFPADIPAGYKLVYAQDFARPEALADFQFTDPSAWKPSKDGGRPALELVKQSDYKPPHRSPFNIALLKNHKVGDCVIEFEGCLTSDPVPHADMLCVFGFRDPAHMYYAHIAAKRDQYHNNVFIVNDAPRAQITKEANAGNVWGRNVWHTVRVERKISDGTIKVYFDDLKAPAMWAEDKTLGAGWVGFGSFDDLGKITNIKVWAATAEVKPAPAFGK